MGVHWTHNTHWDPGIAGAWEAQRIEAVNNNCQCVCGGGGLRRLTEFNPIPGRR